MPLLFADPRIRAVDLARRTPLLTTDLDAIAHNVHAFRRHTGAAVMAVVKADAFGHGVGAVARAAVAAGAQWLGVTSIAEAVMVRAADASTPCLSWLNPVDADFALAIRHGVDIAVPSREHVIAVARGAASAGEAARVHLHADTGMARDGAPAERWAELCDLARAAEVAGLIRVIGVMGHLPCADDPADASNAAGRTRFAAAIAAARSTGLRPSLAHLAATAAALNDPAATHDLVRIGAGLVGITPSPAGGTPTRSVLRPALRFTAPVVLTREVAAGTPLGYGHASRAAAATTLALLPVGYADGIPRRIDPGAAVWLDGRRCPVVGRVCMDQLVVDTGGRRAELGSVATIFGPGDGGEPTAGEWAGWAGTLEHEIVTGIGQRVRRAVQGSTRDAAWAAA